MLGRQLLVAFSVTLLLIGYCSVILSHVDSPVVFCHNDLQEGMLANKRQFLYPYSKLRISQMPEIILKIT